VGKGGCWFRKRNDTHKERKQNRQENIVRIVVVMITCQLLLPSLDLFPTLLSNFPPFFFPSLFLFSLGRAFFSLLIFPSTVSGDLSVRLSVARSLEKRNESTTNLVSVSAKDNQHESFKKKVRKGKKRTGMR